MKQTIEVTIEDGKITGMIPSESPATNTALEAVKQVVTELEKTFRTSSNITNPSEENHEHHEDLKDFLERVKRECSPKVLELLEEYKGLIHEYFQISYGYVDFSMFEAFEKIKNEWGFGRQNRAIELIKSGRSMTEVIEICMISRSRYENIKNSMEN